MGGLSGRKRSNSVEAVRTEGRVKAWRERLRKRYVPVQERRMENEECGFANGMFRYRSAGQKLK